MSKAVRSFGVLLAAALLCGSAWGQGGKPAGAPGLHKPAGTVKLRVFQGAREGALEPVKAVTASYLSYTVAANIQAEADQAVQSAKIKGVFNLRDVSVLTEADLAWEPGKADKSFHFFQIDKRFYLVMMTPVAPAQRRFRIEVFEQNGGAKVSLLDTEFSLPEKNFAVFGFDDKDGKPYFLSLQTVLWPVSETGVERIQEGDALRAIGSIQPPRLIKEVVPIYPPAATQAGVEGIVILEAQTDIYGRVMNIKVLRSIPLLDQAAIESVRQWVYEPAVIDGKPRSIIFTVTVRFTLKDAKPDVAVSDGVSQPKPLTRSEAEIQAKLPPLRFEGESTPKLIKQVQPVYPEEARQAKVEGTVVMEAETDIYGRVMNIKILRSVPKLDQAALDALRQWVFEPPQVDGKPRKAIFTLPIRFVLDKAPKK